MDRHGDLSAVGSDAHVPIATGRNRRGVSIDGCQIFRVAVGDIHGEQMLPLPDAPLVPMPVEQISPQTRVSGILPIASVDLLVGRPLDVAGHQKSLAIGEPDRIEHPIGDGRHLARLAARKRQDPKLGAALSRGDECHAPPIGRPARLAVGAGPLRELPSLSGHRIGNPDAGRAAIVGQRIRRHGVGDPFSVGRELRTAHVRQGEIVNERDGALLRGAGTRHEGWRKSQSTDHREALPSLHVRPLYLTA